MTSFLARCYWGKSRNRYSRTLLPRSWFSYFPGFYVQNCRSRRAPSCPGAFSFFYIFADLAFFSRCPLRHISRFYCICFVSNSIDKSEKSLACFNHCPCKSFHNMADVSCTFCHLVICQSSLLSSSHGNLRLIFGNCWHSL